MKLIANPVILATYLSKRHDTAKNRGLPVKGKYTRASAYKIME
jgi:hypothetical protein